MIRFLLLFICMFTAVFCAGGEMDGRLKKRFVDAVETGDIMKCCRNRNSWCVPFFTSGGDLIWETVICRNWKLQQNKLTGNWRIVDPDGVRRAHGNGDVLTAAHHNAFQNRLSANLTKTGIYLFFFLIHTIILSEKYFIHHNRIFTAIKIIISQIYEQVNTFFGKIQNPQTAEAIRGFL